MNTTTPEAAAALEQIRQSGFRITSHTGAYRLTRGSSQVQLYRSDGKLDASGLLALVTEISPDEAALRGLKVMQSVRADEQRRLALPRPVFGLPGSYRPAIG